MNKQLTPEEARKLERRLTLFFTTAGLLFLNVCLPALVIGGVLYWVFGR